MIIQLKNQEEFNAVLVGLRCLELVLENRDISIAFPTDEFEEMLAFGIGGPIAVEEIQPLAERINSDIIVCSSCEAEFTSPFDSVLCPDCSKKENQ